jgi:hypothetical protein
VPVWQQKVEHVLMAAYSFLPSLLLRADGSERGVLYNGYRILIEQVIVLATRELNTGVVAFEVRSQALHHVHAQRDLHDLLEHHSVGAGAFARLQQAPLQGLRNPPPPQGFTTPTGFGLQANDTFEQYQLPLVVQRAAALRAQAGGAGGGGDGGGDSPDGGGGGNGAGGFGGFGGSGG